MISLSSLNAGIVPGTAPTTAVAQPNLTWDQIEGGGQPSGMQQALNTDESIGEGAQQYGESAIRTGGGNIVKDVGQTIAENIFNQVDPNAFSKIPQADQQGLSTLYGLMNNATKNGNPELATHIANVIKGYQTTDGTKLSDAFPVLNKTPEQIIGDAAGAATTVATAGSGALLDAAGLGGASEATAEAAAMADKGAESIAPSLATNVSKDALVGATSGAGFGASQGMQQGGNANQVGKSTLEGTAAGTVLGAGGGALEESAAGAGAESEAATLKTSPSSPTLDQSVRDTMPAETKAVKVNALENSMPGKGGVQRVGAFGTSEIQPSDADNARGKIADEYIGKTNDPVAKIQNVNAAIKDISKNVVDPFLDEKSSPANFADMRDYIEANNKPSANLAKDPGASEAYNRSSENALDTLYKTMKKSANESGDFSETTPGSNIRQARIAVDKEIKAELGENTFGTPQYKGIKAAEVNVRGVLNNMQEDMLRYPGQLEQLNKYNDFVSTLKAENPDVQISPEHADELKSKFGLSSTPESESDAQFLKDQHNKMSNLYDARDNMIDKYVNDVGKNRVEETIENNKILSGAVKLGKYGARRVGSMELFSLLRKL